MAHFLEKYFFKQAFLANFKIFLENVSHFTLNDVTYTVSLLFFCPSPFSFTKVFFFRFLSLFSSALFIEKLFKFFLPISVVTTNLELYNA